MADVRLWLCGNAVRMLEFARPFRMAFRRVFCAPASQRAVTASPASHRKTLQYRVSETRPAASMNK